MKSLSKLKPYVIGLDLGGTNSVFGIVDSRGDIKATTSIKTQGYEDVNDYVAASVEALQLIIDQVGGIDTIKAMGIGAPNGNYYNGTIEFAPNLSWGHNGVVPLAKMFSEKLGIPVALTNDANAAAIGEMTYGVARGMKNFIVITLGTGVGSGIVVNGLFSEKLGIPVALTNDANAAAIGEMTYGVARGMKNFIVITLGTGVGSGIVVNGQLVYGSDGFAGELGHVVVRREDGRSCGCGRNGCLEAYCSATGVARTARELLETTEEPSLLREMILEDITSLDVSIAAEKGDKLAQHVYQTTGEMLGEACANFAAFCSPEAFIFFGGLTKAGDLLMKPLKASYDKNVLKIYKDKAKFLISGLDGSSAAVLGASAIGWEI